MKRTLITIALASTLAATSASAKDNTWEKEASDAWIDGKAEATLLFNTNLDSFDINTDVKGGVVILTGKVERSVDKKLAEELVEGIDGVKEVENQITIVESAQQDKSNHMDKSTFTDAKIATVIKTRFLFDTDVDASDIEVDVENGEVTLRGEVASSSEKQLAVAIAKNTADVRDVNTELKIVKES
ncbi:MULTISPECIES: BON domain-containing protein [Pseudoalteromonas]|uniref:Transporter n=1 Tax=Pseudoalteromonas amylolytica TaxID=1859457 RepID=A0A1S1MR40_9GAMM|nr:MULTISPECIES: BON domain-containing protein [Pseudoalteromonas]MCF6436285.1 BON domain-containing protein [Pseudoalteromonas sp. MMG022]OHU86790.1 transporter [Pseudoalteromonas sp. JW3]OHU88685.1 transporter [Pseudoalteromonas amylolytica]